MSDQRNKFERIPIWSVVLGVVLLCGVLSMTYGFYRNSETALHVGLAVTMVGAFNGVFFLVIQPGKMKIPRHRHRSHGARGRE